MATKISICSSASVLIGDEVISAIPGASTVSKVCDQIYDNTVNMELSSYPWKFAKAQASLAKLTAEPLFKEYKNAFQLPSGFQRVIRTEYRSDYRIHQNLLYSNQESVNLEYAFLPDVGQFPAYFSRVIELKLAQLLSLSVAEDNSKSETFRKEYEIALMKAKSIDSQNQPPSRIRADVFLRARDEGYDG